MLFLLSLIILVITVNGSKRYSILFQKISVMNVGCFSFVSKASLLHYYVHIMPESISGHDCCRCCSIVV